MIIQIITPSQVKNKFSENEEFALLDVRDQGAFSEGHQLFACCLPLNRLELRIRDLVPCYNTQIILVDQRLSEPLCPAEEAARRLDGFGYTNIAIMEGVIQRWDEAGHMKESRNAPGGQLTSGVSAYVAVRNARIVLVDDTEVRALMTASWLIQMGWNEVYICEGGIGSSELVQGAHRTEIPEFTKGLTITTQELKTMIDSGIILSSSIWPTKT